MDVVYGDVAPELDGQTQKKIVAKNDRDIKKIIPRSVPPFRSPEKIDLLRDVRLRHFYCNSTQRRVDRKVIRRQTAFPTPYRFVGITLASGSESS